MIPNQGTFVTTYGVTGQWSDLGMLGWGGVIAAHATILTLPVVPLRGLKAEPKAASSRPI